MPARFAAAVVLVGVLAVLQGCWSYGRDVPAYPQPVQRGAYIDVSEAPVSAGVDVRLAGLRSIEGGVSVDFVCIGRDQTDVDAVANRISELSEGWHQDRDEPLREIELTERDGAQIAILPRQRRYFTCLIGTTCVFPLSGEPLDPVGDRARSLGRLLVRTPTDLRRGRYRVRLAPSLETWLGGMHAAGRNIVVNPMPLNVWLDVESVPVEPLFAGH